VDSYDVVVVGSGPCGATYARTILEWVPAARVLLVESGPVVSRPPGRHVRTIADPKERLAAQLASQGPHSQPADWDALLAQVSAPPRGLAAAYAARPGTWLLGADAVQPGEDGMVVAALSSNVGGMGAHWSGACPPPGPGERITDLPAAELDQALAAARSLLRVTQTAFASAPLGAQVRSILAGHYDEAREPARRVQPMPLALEIGRNGERYWTGPHAILEPLLDGRAPGFELRPETTARQILTSGERATGLVLHDRRADRLYQVGARAVVVAADPLRSPQLLWASGIRPEALGHYLNDQPQVCGTVRLPKRLAPAGGGRHQVRDGSVDNLSGVSWVPYDRVRFPFHGQIMQMDASPVPVDSSFETWPGSIVELSMFAVKEIRYEDCLTFDESTADYFGLPSIKIHYNLTSSDRALISDLVAEVERMTEFLGESVTGAPEVYPTGSSIHYQGTVRLGPADDGLSVCSPHSRVWGTRNVYVGGNGVIPTPTACNPTLTSVALSVLGARELVRGLT
jgi:choline dehydrogenase-like flavoprotein